MGSLQYANFDTYTREQRLAPARKLAASRGHLVADFPHLLWIDANASDSLLRRLLAKASPSNFESRLSEFRDGLLRTYLAAEPKPLGLERVGFSDSLITVTSALLERSAPVGSNLERLIEALPLPTNRKGAITWPMLLAAMLEFRPHRVVPLVSIDFGFSGDQITGELDAVVSRNQSAPLSHSLTESTDPLAIFATDLTAQAKQGQLDEVIGRDIEIERIASVLCQREANNPILLGDAGVGKTKIVEGLAVRIAQGRMHPRLQNSRLLSLDIGLLVAGTQYRGQFEDRLKAVLRELKQAEGAVLVFIDEVHQLLGLGQTGGAMDAANLLKPALARGEIRCIGATTYEEYRLIERDAALKRRFQPVDIAEPNEKDLSTILERVAPIFESFHGVNYSSESLRSTVTMGRRYLGELRSPAREIGLLDEVGSKVSLTGAEPLNDSARRSVGVADVQAVISRRTGIPVSKMTLARKQLLLGLENGLGARIFGQKAVIASVARAVRRGMIGLGHPKRPRAVFMFAGPTGVGKTELANALAELLYDGSDSIIRFDMSEFKLETSRNRLIGPDPGYVGSEEGGILTNAVRRRPFSLVLLDEFEKAHPDVWRLFLQVIDEGRLTDGKGRTIKFNETVIVMTSNVGSVLMAQLDEVRQRLQKPPEELKSNREVEEELDALCREVAGSSSGSRSTYLVLKAAASQIVSGGQTYENLQRAYGEIIKFALLNLPNFPAELLGRIGTPIAFSPLSSTELRQILDGLLIELVEKIARIRGFEAEPVSDAVAQPRTTIENKESGRSSSFFVAPSDVPRIRVNLTQNCVAWLISCGQDRLLGARALRTLFESEIEGVVADELLTVSDDLAVIDILLDISNNQMVARVATAPLISAQH